MSKATRIWEKPRIWSLEKQKEIFLLDKIPFTTRNKNLIETFQVLFFVSAFCFALFSRFVLVRSLNGRFCFFWVSLLCFLPFLLLYINISSTWDWNSGPLGLRSSSLPTELVGLSHGCLLLAQLVREKASKHPNLHLIVSRWAIASPTWVNFIFLVYFHPPRALILTSKSSVAVLEYTVLLCSFFESLSTLWLLSINNVLVYIMLCPSGWVAMRTLVDWE